MIEKELLGIRRLKVLTILHKVSDIDDGNVV